MTDSPRLAPLTPADRSAEQQQLLDGVGTDLNIFTTLVRNPGLFGVFIRFAGRLLNKSALPARDRETLILRTAYRCACDYEWTHHVEIGHAVGLSDDVIAALATPDATAVDDHTALLARAADQLTTERELDDQTWSELSQRYDEPQMIELCMLVGEYAMIAGVLKSLRVPLEDEPRWLVGE
jgi:alkylhydroperoxidase family enzyme